MVKHVGGELGNVAQLVEWVQSMLGALSSVPRPHRKPGLVARVCDGVMREMGVGGRKLKVILECMTSKASLAYTGQCPTLS